MNAVNPLQPSALDARPPEPSMEEILASIRRIIADDQVAAGAAAGLTAGVPRDAAVAEAASFVRATFGTGMREAVRPTGAEPPPAEPVVPRAEPTRAEAARAEPSRADPPRAEATHVEPFAPRAAPPAEPVTRADEHRREPAAVHREFAGMHRELDPSPEPADNVGAAYGQVTAPQFPTPEGLPTDWAAGRGAPALAQASDDAAPDFDDGWQADEVAEPPAFPHGREWGTAGAAAHPHTGTQRDAHLGAHAADESAADERPAALFSSSTKQSVSSAFNVLAATRLADNSDELLGLARDMIRPLLKTWLDDNLPSLVERIVRAEIERVARGGR